MVCAHRSAFVTFDSSEAIADSVVDATVFRGVLFETFGTLALVTTCGVDTHSVDALLNLVTLVHIGTVGALLVFLEARQTIASERSWNVVTPSVDANVFESALIDVFTCFSVVSGCVSLRTVALEASFDVDALPGSAEAVVFQTIVVVGTAETVAVVALVTVALVSSELALVVVMAHETVTVETSDALALVASFRVRTVGVDVAVVLGHLTFVLVDTDHLPLRDAVSWVTVASVRSPGVVTFSVHAHMWVHCTLVNVFTELKVVG